MTDDAEVATRPIGGVSIKRGKGYAALCFDRPLAVISTAPVGGAHRRVRSMVNITVPSDFDERQHPEDALAHIVALAGLVWPYVGFLTAVDTQDAVITIESDEARRVLVMATVGIGNGERPGESRWDSCAPGTIHHARAGLSSLGRSAKHHVLNTARARDGNRYPAGRGSAADGGDDTQLHVG